MADSRVEKLIPGAADDEARTEISPDLAADFGLTGLGL